MTTSTAWLHAAWVSRTRSSTAIGRLRLHGDRGEGVISVAIAVLIMAFLGAAMWIGFQSIWQTTSEKTNNQVEQIGGP
jgi:hypothetical protein